MTGSENNTSQYTAESRLRRMDRHVRSSLEGFMEQEASVRASKNIT